MVRFNRVQVQKLLQLGNHRNSLTIYDVFRPIFYCCLPFGTSPFSVREETFKNSIWLTLWNSLIFTICTAFALVALTSRIFNEDDGMYLIMDIVLGWVSAINCDVIIIFGCVFKNKVNSFLFYT